MFKYVNVYIEHNSLSLNQTFTYRCAYDVQVGCRVKVPFGTRQLVGFVDEVLDRCELENVKDVIEVLDQEPLVNQEAMELADYMSDTYVCSKISCLKTMLPPALKPSSSSKKIIYEDWAYKSESDAPLTKHQQELLDTISFPLKASEFRKLAKSSSKKLIEAGFVRLEKREKYIPLVSNSKDQKTFPLTQEQKDAIKEIQSTNDFIYLLHGVTGSGKTEVFLQLASQVVQKGKQVLFLVPEIGLTPMMIQRVSARFGTSIAIYHSHLSAQEKYNQYRLVKDNKVQIIVGTRSSIFMPFSNLGLILMDEEHDASYKQENQPRYHTLDIVKWRANYHRCKVVLASATPSLESYARAIKNVYHLVTLSKRIYVSMPEIHLVDMKKEQVHFHLSQTLIAEIHQALDANKQVILLLNRRGYLPVVRCMDCNATMSCPDCGIALTYHKKEDALMCHSCGRLFHFDHTCPNCGGKNFYQLGLGTEKLEENVQTLFPDACIVRMDADSTRRKNSHEKLLKEFEQNGDILIGTQMVAKGLDFERVSLVGVLNADATLARMDFRSAELAYQMLEQASGRSGRGKDQGKVIIQTFDTENYVMQSVIHHNYIDFFQKEMRYRHMGMYPPYVYMCTLICSHVDASKALACAQDLKEHVTACKVLGLVQISMRQKKQRVRLVLKCSSDEVLNREIWDIVNFYQSMKTNVTLDINMHPLSLEE